MEKTKRTPRPTPHARKCTERGTRAHTQTCVQPRTGVQGAPEKMSELGLSGSAQDGVHMGLLARAGRKKWVLAAGCHHLSQLAGPTPEWEQ